MSTIKSSDEHLTLNADGSSKDIKFQANGVEKASISSSGAFTSTSIDATKLTGDLPAISGAALTGLSASDSTKMPLAGGTFTGGVTFNGTQTLSSSSYWIAGSTNNAFSFNSVGDAANLFIIKNDGRSTSEFTARAWCRFSGTGTPAISESHNVSSLTDISTGNWNVNFQTAMATTFYATVSDCRPDSYDDENCSSDSLATTYVRVDNRRTGSGAGVDNDSVSVIVFKE